MDRASQRVRAMRQRESSASCSAPRHSELVGSSGIDRMQTTSGVESSIMSRTNADDVRTTSIFNMVAERPQSRSGSITRTSRTCSSRGSTTRRWLPISSTCSTTSTTTSRLSRTSMSTCSHGLRHPEAGSQAIETKGVMSMRADNTLSKIDAGAED